MCWAIFGKVTNKQPSDPSASFFLTSVRKQSFAISDLVNCCFGEKVPRCHDLAFKTPTTFRNVTVAELNWGQKVREAAVSVGWDWCLVVSAIAQRLGGKRAW